MSHTFMGVQGRTACGRAAVLRETQLRFPLIRSTRTKAMFRASCCRTSAVQAVAFTAPGRSRGPTHRRSAPSRRQRFATAFVPLKPAPRAMQNAATKAAGSIDLHRCFLQFRHLLLPSIALSTAWLHFPALCVVTPELCRSRCGAAWTGPAMITVAG